MALGYVLELPRNRCKLEFHYTPKHGSWLNMAEIEMIQKIQNKKVDRTNIKGSIAV